VNVVYFKSEFFVNLESRTDSDDEGESRPTEHKMSEMEKIWRSESFDYKMFFCGHCNTTTDIKEANFFGRYLMFNLKI
jgi:WD and tetratricopeptide repeats protein 1